MLSGLAASGAQTIRTHLCAAASGSVNKGARQLAPQRIPGSVCIGWESEFSELQAWKTSLDTAVTEAGDSGEGTGGREFLRN